MKNNKKLRRTRACNHFLSSLAWWWWRRRSSSYQQPWPWISPHSCSCSLAWDTRSKKARGKLRIKAKMKFSFVGCEKMNTSTSTRHIWCIVYLRCEFNFFIFCGRIYWFLEECTSVTTSISNVIIYMTHLKGTLQVISFLSPCFDTIGWLQLSYRRNLLKALLWETDRGKRVAFVMCRLSRRSCRAIKEIQLYNQRTKKKLGKQLRNEGEGDFNAVVVYCIMHAAL